MTLQGYVSRKFLLLGIGITAVAIAVFTFFSLSIYLERINRSNLTAENLVATFRPLLLESTDAEIYSKCKNLFAGSELLSIQIIRGATIVCEQKSGHFFVLAHSIAKTIRFSEGGDEAGSILISSDISIFVYLAIGFLCFLILIVTVSALTIRRMKTELLNGISVPIEKILSGLENRKTAELYDEELNFSEVKILNQRSNAMIKDLDIYEEKIKKAAEREAFSKLATEVAHDIRSPLAALEVAIKNSLEIPEEQRILVQSATARIRDIANNLLNKNHADKAQSEKPSIQLLSALVDLIISEKRMEYRARTEIAIESINNSFGIFALVSPFQLKRVLSNLINNSVESMEKGHVCASVKETATNVIVEISDNGRGIPPEILSKLGRRGISYGKTGTESGSGIGIAHAKEIVEAWGGELKIQSEVNVGTTISIVLQKAITPKWFQSEITLDGKTPIVIDDDLSILRVWEEKFLSNGIKDYLYFDSSENFRSWFNIQQHPENFLFLFDLELLGSSENGLETIENLQIVSQSILVTSRFEEINIQERAESLGLKLLPKSLVTPAPIRVKPQPTHFDIVLVDNDLMIHQLWRLAAKKKNHILLCFSTSEQLFPRLSKIDQNATFYIDSNLADNDLKGEDLAMELYSRGYKNLYLSTGYNPEKFKDKPWLKGVIGKDPPWLA